MNIRRIAMQFQQMHTCLGYLLDVTLHKMIRLRHEKKRWYDYVSHLILTNSWHFLSIFP